jgi:hypothetical protein
VKKVQVKLFLTAASIFFGITNSYAAIDAWLISSDAKKD